MLKLLWGGGMNFLVGKFWRRKWAYLLLSPIHFSFGIRLPPEVHIQPCSSILSIFLRRLTSWGGHHYPGPGVEAGCFWSAIEGSHKSKLGSNTGPLVLISTCHTPFIICVFLAVLGLLENAVPPVLFAFCFF
jgi:hypothetical protein